ncbi:lasso RiPP family leader peptide-containing protein [Streptomyces cuspidosporus]|uniref:Esterase n=1 Tax=Streptomyces cuspidosporus TaxID=66882 RepID=A0ABN3GB44_9ACTN
MDATPYEAPALFVIGGFADKTRWVHIGWLPDLVTAGYAG